MSCDHLARLEVNDAIATLVTAAALAYRAVSRSITAAAFLDRRQQALLGLVGRQLRKRIADSVPRTRCYRIVFLNGHR